MIGIYIWRERYIPFGMNVGEGTTAGGSRCDRGRERVRRRVGVGAKEVGEMFRVGSMRLRGKMGNRFASERLDWGKKQWDESGKRDSNSRPSAWEADALPTELLPH